MNISVKKVEAVEVRVVLPGDDGYHELSLAEARYLYDALGEMLYPDDRQGA